MSQRIWTFAFALLLGVWFAVVVPAHERGAVAVPGEQSDSCCPPKDTVPPCHDESEDDPVRRCALCQFTGTLDVAVPFVIDLPPRHMVAVCDERHPGNPTVALPFGPIQSRAPPA